MMMETLTTTYSISLPILLGYIVWLLKEQRKVRGANSFGTRCLLKIKLIEYHEKYMQEGSIPHHALQNWNEMYKAYEGLNGNGTGPQMDKDIKSLHIRYTKKED